MLPGILIGVLLMNASTGVPSLFAVSTMIGNSLEAIVGVYLLQRYVQFHPALDRVRDVLGLTMCAVISPVISASIGVVGLALADMAPWAAFGPLWVGWWVGDAVGILLVTPVFLTWAGQRPMEWARPVVLEWLSFLTLLIVTSQLVFEIMTIVQPSQLPLTYIPFVFLIWAALRLGQPAASTATLLVGGIAAVGTIQGTGPFGSVISHVWMTDLVLLVNFLLVFSLTGMLLSAALTERRRAQQQFQTIFDAMPAMIWYKDRANNILRANRAAYESVGLTAASTQGKSTADLYPDEAAHYFQDDAEVMQTGKPKLGIIEPYQGAKGAKKWIRTDKIPIGMTRAILLVSLYLRSTLPTGLG